MAAPRARRAAQKARTPADPISESVHISNSGAVGSSSLLMALSSVGCGVRPSVLQRHRHVRARVAAGRPGCAGARHDSRARLAVVLPQRVVVVNGCDEARVRACGLGAQSGDWHGDGKVRQRGRMRCRPAGLRGSGAARTILGAGCFLAVFLGLGWHDGRSAQVETGAAGPRRAATGETRYNAPPAT